MHKTPIREAQENKKMKAINVDNSSEIPCKRELRNWEIEKNLESQKLFVLWKLQCVHMLMERSSGEGKGYGIETEGRNFRKLLEAKEIGHPVYKWWS